MVGLLANLLDRMPSAYGFGSTVFLVHYNYSVAYFILFIEHFKPYGYFKDLCIYCYYVFRIVVYFWVLIK